MAKLFIKSYSRTLKNGKADYIEPAVAQGIVKDFLDAVNQRKQKDVLTKRTFVTKRQLQILLDNPKHFKIKEGEREELFAYINDWLKNDENSPYNYKVVDGIFRLSGTGSVGTNRYTFLLKTLNKNGDKYFLLDMKQAIETSLLPYLPFGQPTWRSEADRVIFIQKKMQNRCPTLLSTCEFKGVSYIMEEMQSAKDKINFKLLKNRYRDMCTVIDSMAVLTASSQLRSSGQSGSAITDKLSEFGQSDHWQEALLDYAWQSSSRFKKYYEEFCHDFSAYDGIGDGHRLLTCMA